MNLRFLSPVTLWLLFLAFVVASVADAAHLAYFFSDDGYYYLKVAKNLSLGLGASFDGISESNGFHPLWMLVNVLCFLVLGDGGHLGLRGVFALQSAFYIGSLGCIAAWHNRLRGGSFGIYGSTVLFLILATPLAFGLNGLETALFVLLLFALCVRDAHKEFLKVGQSRTQSVELGLWLAGLALCRLDSVFILVALATVAAFREQWPTVRSFSRLLDDYFLTSVTFLAVVSPYFIWNWLQFDHLTPISGSLKSTFPEVTFRSGFLTSVLHFPTSLLLAILLLFAMQRSSRGVPSSVPASHALLMYAITFGALLQLLWAIFFMAWGTFQWHFAAFVPPAVLILGRWYGWILNFVPARLGTVLVLTLTIGTAIGFNLYVIREKGSHHADRLLAAEWTRTNLPPHAVIGLRDAGAYGYFSDRSVINLDGLINSYAYADALRSGKSAEYFSAVGMEYIAHAYAPCDDSQTIVNLDIDKGRKSFKRVQLFLNSDQVIYKGKPTLTGPADRKRRRCFSIWHYPAGVSSIR